MYRTFRKLHKIEIVSFCVVKIGIPYYSIFEVVLSVLEVTKKIKKRNETENKNNKASSSFVTYPVYIHSTYYSATYVQCSFRIFGCFQPIYILCIRTCIHRAQIFLRFCKFDAFYASFQSTTITTTTTTHNRSQLHQTHIE